MIRHSPETAPPRTRSNGWRAHDENDPSPAPRLSWADAPEFAVSLDGEPLSLAQTLTCGQAFRWRPVKADLWEGVAGGHVWRLRIAGDVLVARVVPAWSEPEAAAFLRHYFSLDLPTRLIRETVSRGHPLAAQAATAFAGLRILRQDAVETILTFTIATATNVPRVTRSVAALCQRYGKPIAVVDGLEHQAFPRSDVLLAASEATLFADCNLAYRARSIQAVAREIVNRGPSWLDHVGRLSYAEAQQELDRVPFLGPKVSDCICLFGLGLSDAVPVDLHVWAIAHELFGGDIPTRTLTARTYRLIGDRFRSLFSPWAGWAQQYLFCARRALPMKERFRPG